MCARPDTMSEENPNPPGMVNDSAPSAGAASEASNSPPVGVQQVAPPPANNAESGTPQVEVVAVASSDGAPMSSPSAAVAPPSEVDRIHELVRSDPVLRARLEERLLDDNAAMGAARANGEFKLFVCS